MSPGDWSYRDEGGGSVAMYGPLQAPTLLVRCERSREISLIRTGAASGALTVRTSFGARTLAAVAQADGLAVRLAAGDSVLDEMAFSRGRVAIEAAGTERLLVPSWPELARVVEDCRG